jgi:chromosome partitioning protein
MSHPQMKQTPPRVLAVANQKGGVGKTTTAINLGTAMAAIGECVLIVDLDPQGNASTGLGIDQERRKVSTYDVLMDPQMVSQSFVPTQVPGLMIIPSTLDLLGAEADLSKVPGRAFRLREAIDHVKQAKIKTKDGPKPFSYIFIDCPPSLNLLTINALAAADSVLVPMQAEFFAMEGLSQLTATIDDVQKSLNPGLDIMGIVLTMVDDRTKLSKNVAEEVATVFGEKLYKAVIPRNVRVSEAPSFGKPVLLYDMHSAGSKAYIELASEILRKERTGGQPRKIQIAG